MIDDNLYKRQWEDGQSGLTEVLQPDQGNLRRQRLKYGDDL